MEPPSYEEASLQPPAAGPRVYLPPYHASSSASPSTPPPSYEAVTVAADPFPVLTPPVVPVAPTQNPANIIHPVTQIGRMPPAAGVHPVPVQTFNVVVNQPQPVPVQIPRLTNIPALVRCTCCNHTVVTKVTQVPSSSAWVLCILIALLGLICGFCLIPLMVKSLQNSNHSCPKCKAHLFTYRR